MSDMVSIYGKDCSIEKFVKCLLWIFAALFLLNLFSVYTVYCCGFPLKRIDFNHEVNPPTLYASILLLIASSILKTISQMKTAYTESLKKYWKGLSFIFLFLAADEAFKIHDTLSLGVHGDWLKYYIPLAFIICIFYIKFLFKLPKKISALICFSGALFVTGAVGFEILGILFKTTGGYKTLDVEYRLLATAEESLEFLGVIAFIYTLLIFAQSESPKKFFIKLPFDEFITKKTSIKK